MDIPFHTFQSWWDFTAKFLTLLNDTPVSDESIITGKPLQLHLQACDVKSKEEKSGPESMLVESSTGDGRWALNHFFKKSHK